MEYDGNSPQEHPDAEHLRSELDSILTSPGFVRSKKLAAFLQFIVEKKISGDADEISEHAIGTDVYLRGSSFDPVRDNIVRTEARRLRQRLEKYYSTEGAQSPFRLSIPTGSYVPELVQAPTFWARLRHDRQGAPTRWDLRKKAVLWLALAAVLVVAVLLVRFGVGGRSAPGLGSVGVPRIAVALPEAADERSGIDEADLALAHALTQELIRTPGLDVVRMSTRGEEPEVEADYVLEGRVKMLEERGVYDVALSLTKTRNSRLLWVDTYTGDWSYILDSTPDIGRAVSAALDVRPDPRHAGDGIELTTNLQAYQAFVNGQTSTRQYVSYWERPRADEAERQLHRAIELDPGFPQAYIELAYVKLSSLYPPPSSQRREEILAEAEAALDKALSLGPGSAPAIALQGWLAQERGMPLEGLRLCRQALRVDPGNDLTYVALAFNYLALGFYEAAAEQSELAINHGSTDGRALLVRLFSLAAMGKIEETVALADQYQEKFPKICHFYYAKAQAYLRTDLALAEDFAAKAVECEPSSSELQVIFSAIKAFIEAENGNRRPLLELVESNRQRACFAYDAFLLACARSGDAELTAARIRASVNHSNYRWLVTAPLPSEIVRAAPMRALATELYAEWLASLASLSPDTPAPPRLPSPDEWLSQVQEEDESLDGQPGGTLPKT